MQRILYNVESWCSDRDLSVNLGKTETILFTRKYKPAKLSHITFYGKELILSTQVKYLGYTQYSKCNSIEYGLNWQLHLDAKYSKAICIMFAGHLRIKLIIINNRKTTVILPQPTIISKA